MPRGLISGIALLIVPALAAYLMRRYMVPSSRLPLPVIPVAAVEKARSIVAAVVESPAVKRARNAASRVLRKGRWRLTAFSERA